MNRQINGEWYEATNSTYRGGYGVTKSVADEEAAKMRARGELCRVIKTTSPEDRRRVGFIVFRNLDRAR